MHILIIPSWYPRPNNPFSGIFFKEQAEELSRRGYQVSIITHQYITLSEIIHSKSFSNILPKIKFGFENQLYVIRIQVPKIWHTPLLNKKESSINNNSSLKIQPLVTNNFCSTMSKFVKKMYFIILKSFYIRAFKKLISTQKKPGIIIAQSFLYGGCLAIEIKKIFHIPVIVIEHSSAFSRNLIPEGSIPLLVNAINNSDKVFAVSQYLADQLRKIVQELKIEILPNPVNTNFFTQETTTLLDTPFIFSIICYLTQQKGVDIVIKSMAKDFKNKEVILKIGGDGSYKFQLLNLVKKLKMEDQVIFLGNLSRSEVKVLIQQSHALISSSYFETFGITIIESFSCGKPVISTMSGGPNSLINPDNGILVPVGDISSMSKAMKTIINNYSFYNHDKIRQSCMELYSFDIYYEKIEKIINSLISLS